MRQRKTLKEAFTLSAFLSTRWRSRTNRLDRVSSQAAQATTLMSALLCPSPHWVMNVINSSRGLKCTTRLLPGAPVYCRLLKGLFNLPSPFFSLTHMLTRT